MTDPAVRPKPACARCGAPMGRGRRRAGTCRACVLGAAAARRERIAALRAHGATSREISKAQVPSGSSYIGRATHPMRGNRLQLFASSIFQGAEPSHDSSQS